MKFSSLSAGVLMSTALLAAAPSHSQGDVPDLPADLKLLDVTSTYVVMQLRYRLAENPGLVVDATRGMIDPILLQTTDIEAALERALPNAVGRIGCLTETGYVIGYYDPISHVWVVADVEAWGEISDIALGRGFPLQDGESAWWPYLVEEAGGVMAAFQSATLQQIGAFTALFGNRECQPFEEIAAHFRPSEAAAQIRGIEEEWKTFTPQNADQAIGDLYTAMNDERGPLRPSYMIVLDTKNILVPFHDPDGHEWVFMSRWEVNPQTGRAQVAGGRTLFYMPRSEAPTEGGE